MAGGYDIQLSKTLNRTDLQADYTGDSDYSTGILYVELLPNKTIRIGKKNVKGIPRGTVKSSRKNITTESGTNFLYRTISGVKRYLNYLYDYMKLQETFKISGTVKASSRVNLETAMNKFYDLQADGGNMTFTWHNLTFEVNITTLTFTENTKKMGFAMNYEILLIVGSDR